MSFISLSNACLLFYFCVLSAEALLTSGCFADGSEEGKAAANSTPSKAAYQAQRRVTLVSNRYFHQSYKFFRCISVDIMRHVADSATFTAHAALFSFYSSGGESTRDFVTADNAGGKVLSRGFIYSVEVTDSAGARLVYQIIPRQPLSVGLMAPRTLAGAQHIQATLSVLKLVTAHVFLLGGSRGFLRACVLPVASAAADADSLIAGGANGVIECSDEESAGNAHDVEATVGLICTSDSCSNGGAGATGGPATFARVHKGLYYCSADDRGGLCLWQLQQEFAPGAKPDQVPPLRAKGVICSSININSLQRKRGLPAGRSFTSVRDEAAAQETVVGMQFVGNDNYLLVTTSAGRVLLLGITQSTAASVSDTLLAGVVPSAAKRLSQKSGLPSVVLSSWTEVAFSSAAGAGHGTTPPASLSAVSNTGTNRPTRVHVAVDHFTECGVPGMRLVVWKVTMNTSGNSAAASNNAIVCKRQVYPESVLLFAVSQLVPL
jgi:hypothetical protein